MEGKDIGSLIDFQSVINGKSFTNFLHYYIAYAEKITPETAKKYLKHANQYFLNHQDNPYVGSYIKHLATHIEEDGYFEFKDKCNTEEFDPEIAIVTFPSGYKPWKNVQRSEKCS